MGARGTRQPVAVAVLLLGASCGVLVRWGSTGQSSELLQLGYGERAQPFARQALGLAPQSMPPADRLPYDAMPEDASTAEDALEIASRRIDEAYEELYKQHERLLRDQEEYEMDQTGDTFERRMQQERLEAAAKELGEYARVLNSKKDAIDARRRQLEIAASSPYIAYADALQTAAPGQYVVPPPTKDGVQMNINVNHHKTGPVNMNINVDDRYDDDDKYDDSELPSTAEGNAYMDASMFPEAATAYGQDAVPIAAAAKGTSEGQELRGAAFGPGGERKRLSAQEMKKGKVMLMHIRDKLDAASTVTGANIGKGKNTKQAKTVAPHSLSSSTQQLGLQQKVQAPKERRLALHTGGAHARKVPTGGAMGKIRISKAQQLVDHLPHSVFKKLQAAENAAGVGAEGPGAGSEITGWGEGAAKAPTKKAHGAFRGKRAAAARSNKLSKLKTPAFASKQDGAASTALKLDKSTALKSHKSVKFKPMFNFNFDGFGMKLAANVQTWQPGAAAWYAYLPPDEVDNSMRRSSLEEGDESSARPTSAGLGFALASALLVCAVTHRL